MIKVEGIKKIFDDKADKPLFQNISFVINSGEKIGLVGKNGSGKTTLLKIIIGQIEVDEGNIIIDKNERIGYLPQTLESDFKKTIRQFFLDNQKIQDWEIEKTLNKLELYNINFERKLESFSGGEMTRISLAKVLISDPTMLLLDEPTNHLDIEGITYLQNFLSSYKGGVLIISHDRWILDGVVTKIIDLQLTEKGRISKIYSGNFSVYKEVRQKEIEKQEQLYKLQQKKIKKAEKEIRKVKDRAIGLEGRTTGADFSIRKKATKVVKRLKSKEKRIQKFLESEERVEKPQKEKLLRFEFVNYLSKGQRVIQTKNISFGFKISSSKKRILFDAINLELYGKDRVVLMGYNGSGKTTFIECLIGKLKATQGEIVINPSVKIGYLPQEVIFEDFQKTVLEEFEGDIKIDQNEGRRLLGKFLFIGEDQVKRLKDLSLGERRRLYLAKIIASGANFLILDEPTNHMDITSIEGIEKALSQYEGVMLIISHDRYFLKNIGIEKFYYLKEGNLREVHSEEELFMKL